MPASIRIKELALRDDVDHLATDWEISTTLAFNNIVASSMADTVNKTSITFNMPFNPNIKYFARARALLTTGYTTFGNLDVFIPEQVNDIGNSDDLPTRVSIPLLETDSDVSEHDITLFNIKVSGFSVIGTADHSATTWLIEDINGLPIWSRVSEEIDKKNILVDDVILKNDTLYRIKVMFHTSSGDTSQVVTKTIKTVKYCNIELAQYLDNVDVNQHTVLEIGAIEGATQYTWEILYVERGLVSDIWSSITEVRTTTIPAYLLEQSNTYVLRIKDNLNNIWKYFTFSTEPID